MLTQRIRDPQDIAAWAQDLARRARHEDISHEALADRLMWNQLPESVQDAAIWCQAQKHDDLTHIGTEVFECGGQRHRIALFRHDKTGLELSLIPGGAYKLNGEIDDMCPPLFVGRTSVSQAAWDAVGGEDRRRFRGERLPIESVDWNESKAWCKKAGDFDLLYESEWEYACRAGTETAWNFGDDESLIQEYAWIYDNSGGSPKDVGILKPNAFGLFDMHGNVWDWCEDDWNLTPTRRADIDE